MIDDGLTGADIDESTLGSVPNAALQQGKSSSAFKISYDDSYSFDMDPECAVYGHVTLGG